MGRSLNQLAAADRGRTGKQTVDTEPVDTVGWQDLSENSRLNDEVTATQSVSDRIQSSAGESLTIETGSVSATLVGVPEVRIDDLVYAHYRDRLGESTRACALFDVENTGDVPINWTSRQTKFIGSDTYTYRQSHLSVDPAKLAPGCYPSQVEIEPGCRARIITPVEQLPSTVGVAKVIHRVTFRGRLESQRLIYTL